MPHQSLQGIGRYLLGVAGGKCPAKVVEPIAVAGVGVLVFLVALQVDSCLALDCSKLPPLEASL